MGHPTLTTIFLELHTLTIFPWEKTIPRSFTGQRLLLQMQGLKTIGSRSTSREEAACARACCSLLHVGMTAPRTGLLLGSLTWLSHRVTAPHRETTQVFLNQCILRQVFFLFFLSHKINCVPQNFHYEVQFCHSNSN